MADFEDILGTQSSLQHFKLYDPFHCVSLIRTEMSCRIYSETGCCYILLKGFRI